MSAAVQDRPPATLPHTSTTPAELPRFDFPAREPSSSDRPSQTTPTQASFNADSAALPRFASDSNRDRIKAHRSNLSLDSAISDVKEEDDDDDSDNESTASNSRPSKKKKGQRFYCTDYPPCNLSFTRSEHLARHIRKHTGERPFQCHCLRRFSRLDNLRQHAQTVHVNEEIPGDSLAATGTRFQRQVRTDRVRPNSHRNRASTLSASGVHSRGHSRNISNSSIGSVSDLGVDDARRRPPPPITIAQGTPPRSGLAVDTYTANNSAAATPYYNYSPTGYSTPMSVYSSNDVGSPAAQARSLNSPITFMSRTEWAGRTPSHTRRLSVPTQPSLFQQAASTAAGGLFSSASHGQPPFSPIASSVASPTATQFSDSRSHDAPGSPESVWKRRTWHPNAFTGTRPATSGLTYYQTPDAPQPIAATQPAAQQSIRLPGIDSFDRAHVQPQAPPRRPPSAMDVDEPTHREPSHSRTASDAGSKRSSWTSINHHMVHMDIASQAHLGESGWRPAPAASEQRPFTAPYGSTVAQAAAGPQSQAAPLEPSAATVAQNAANGPHAVKPPVFAGEPGPAVVDSPGFRTSPAESASSDGVAVHSTPSVAGDQLASRSYSGDSHIPPAHLVDDTAREQLRHAAVQRAPQPTLPHFAFNPSISHNPLDTLAAAAARNAEQGR